MQGGGGALGSSALSRTPPFLSTDRIPESLADTQTDNTESITFIQLRWKHDKSTLLTAGRIQTRETGIGNGSCFGFRGPICRLRVPVFRYVPQLLVM